MRMAGLTQILLVLAALWFAYPILVELRRAITHEFRLHRGWHDPGEFVLFTLIIIAACAVALAQGSNKS